MTLRGALASGLGAVKRWLGSVRPQRRHLRNDAVAGLPGAISSVPDGMAAAVLAGVSPAHGLYASFAGPLVGGLTSSTRLMVITTTSAAALAAGSALQAVEPAQRTDAVILLTLMAGSFMVVAGLFRLGRYTRFVSHSVMIGFLTGVAVNIVFGQIPDLTGADAEGSFALAKAVDVLTHPSLIDLPSLAAGLGALALLIALSRTRFAIISAVVALVVPTLVVVLANADSVARVEDAGDIPQGVPLPHLPDLGVMSFSLVTGALAVTAIVLVQGAGVAEAAPNEDGSASDSNQNFIAQGAGNLASAFFRGMPVGGSVGQTSVNVAAGARTRWAAIFSGLWMLVILVLFSGVVGLVVLPTLAAVLIFAAGRSLRFLEVRTILRTGATSRIAVVATFTATLFLPVAVAVGIGVVLSLLLQLNQEAMDLSVVELLPRDDGRFVEHPAPAALTSHHVTVLDVYGSLLYAGSRTLVNKLPDPGGTEGAAVVLRLRGRTSLGATFFVVIAGYADRLAAADGRLYLTGLDPTLTERLRRTGRVDLSGPVSSYEATPLVGESTQAAYDDAVAWIVKRPKD